MTRSFYQSYHQLPQCPYFNLPLFQFPQGNITNKNNFTSSIRTWWLPGKTIKWYCRLQSLRFTHNTGLFALQLEPPTFFPSQPTKAQFLSLLLLSSFPFCHPAQFLFPCKWAPDTTSHSQMPSSSTSVNPIQYSLGRLSLALQVSICN